VFLDVCRENGDIPLEPEMKATSGSKTKSFILWNIEYVQDIYIYSI
jgi:hypothetical protein